MLIDRVIENRVENHCPRREIPVCSEYPKLFQPDFICIIFGKMMVSKYQRSDADIQEAVYNWCKDPVAATATYGHIRNGTHQWLLI
jgi:hypothetical protein